MALFRNDIKQLMHRPESLAASILYGLMLLVLFQFAMPRSVARSIPVGSAALWLSIILSGILGLPRLQHHPDALNLLPQLFTANLTPTSYFWEKVMAGYLVLLVNAVILYPLTALLFRFTVQQELIRGFALYVVGLGGISVIMTICASLTAGRETWLFPLLVFPLLLPIVLSGTKLVTGAVSVRVEFPWAWLHVMGSYIVLISLGSWFLSEFLWEELPF
ncbi:MAG: heme exporter protein CcmB [bacterium]